MVGEVQYGGRVTDDYDKRLLNTYAKEWFSDKMFDESFLFYKGKPPYNCCIYDNLYSALTITFSNVIDDYNVRKKL